MKLDALTQYPIHVKSQQINWILNRETQKISGLKNVDQNLGIGGVEKSLAIEQNLGVLTRKEKRFFLLTVIRFIPMLYTPCRSSQKVKEGSLLLLQKMQCEEDSQMQSLRYHILEASAVSLSHLPVHSVIECT